MLAQGDTGNIVVALHFARQALRISKQVTLYTNGNVDNRIDIARIWEEALVNYNGVAKVDIRALLSNKKSVSSIVMEQQRHPDSFRAYRHDEGKLDKLRSFISSNADIVQDAASMVASAASTAFPPSLAILTAFTGVITTSKLVSEDYDMIESFFDVMHLFILRLSLLENKIPAQEAFQKHLITVFSSLLNLTGLARPSLHAVP